MGRLDDPFFGFVPPLVGFPPLSGRQIEGPVMPRRGAAQAEVPARPAGKQAAVPDERSGGPDQPGANPPAIGWQPLDVTPVKGQVEITVDASGQVFLRGVATS